MVPFPETVTYAHMQRRQTVSCRQVHQCMYTLMYMYMYTASTYMCTCARKHMWYTVSLLTLLLYSPISRTSRHVLISPCSENSFLMSSTHNREYNNQHSPSSPHYHNLGLFHVENISYVNISYRLNVIQLPLYEKKLREISPWKKLGHLNFHTGGGVWK